VELYYGRMLSVTGPLTEVQTCFSDHDCYPSTLPERPQFDVIEDLEPYLAGRRRFFLSWFRFWEQ
jgi:hypothetical protein